MSLQTESYSLKKHRLPSQGKVILAQYDTESIVVYQAYRSVIGHFAAQHGYFGGEFSRSRMTWIKPNFLWMMYRSGWGTKEGQEVTLAVRLQRTAFDAILAQAVHAKYIPELYGSEQTWRQAIATSDVRVQWDPDRTPTGSRLERRAIQLGLCGKAVIAYAHEWIVSIEDTSEFVAAQRQHALAKNYDALQTPCEAVYTVSNPATAKNLAIDTQDGPNS